MTTTDQPHVAAAIDRMAERLAPNREGPVTVTEPWLLDAHSLVQLEVDGATFNVPWWQICEEIYDPKETQ